MLAVGWIAYLVIQILFIPVLIVGMIVLLIRQLLVSKSLGVSATAVSVIGMRWTMDVFGIRSDAARPQAVPRAAQRVRVRAVVAVLSVLCAVQAERVCPPFVAPERRGYEAPFKVAMARTLLFDRLLQKWQGRWTSSSSWARAMTRAATRGRCGGRAPLRAGQANTLRFSGIA